MLTGAGFARTILSGENGIGQFLWTQDPEAFLPLDEFPTRVDGEIDQIKSSERLEGVTEVILPGERGLRRRERFLVRGTLPLQEVVWASLRSSCALAGIAPPPVTEEESEE
ncbi:MAG: Ldh family oxidoreductase [Chloroflexi bacterium]|nr:Ldh family oxidoreductase [Chloroflexota bacterium]